MFRTIVAIAAFGLIGLAAPEALAQTVDSKSTVSTQQMQTNKKNVVEFYNAALNEKDFEKASKYLGATYIQHNPVAADGPEGLKGFIAFLKDKFPNNKSDIKRVFADGNYVIVHVHAVRTPGDRGNAIIDIFRLDDSGKVVEHWDAVQPIPEKAANNNGMF
jgi:predicted SnoaL-like aldol condensation-catalyzing enzyme